jgi:hypothetical protein
MDDIRKHFLFPHAMLFEFPAPTIIYNQFTTRLMENTMYLAKKLKPRKCIRQQLINQFVYLGSIFGGSNVRLGAQRKTTVSVPECYY